MLGTGVHETEARARDWGVGVIQGRGGANARTEPNAIEPKYR